MSEQPPWAPPQPQPQPSHPQSAHPQPSQAWPPPQLPTNPYGYPPPQNPYAAPPNAYRYPPPSPYSYPTSPPAHRARNLVIGGIVLALVVAVVGVEAARPKAPTATSSGSFPASGQAPASPGAATQPNQATQPNKAQPNPSLSSDGVTASSSLSAISGVEVFTDDFTDPDSGWWTGSDPKGAVMAYSSDGYTITSAVRAHWLSYAPTDDAEQQLNLNMTAHESAGAAAQAGFGLGCRRGPDSTTNVRYEFIVNESNEWFIERNSGPVSLTSEPTTLDHGDLPSSLGTQDLSITAICATLADGQTTRLALFVGGQKVADITNVAVLDSDGWLGALISSSSGDSSSTTTVYAYTESDLGNDGILAANT
jgi:hypothetical protein